MTRRAAMVAVILAAAIFAAGAWTVHSWRQTMTTAGLPAADIVQAALRQGKPAIVEFGSNSCHGCREMQRILAAFTREHGDRVGVASIDVLANRDYVSRYRIQAIPTQVFYDAEGRETSRHMGMIAPEEILARLGVDPAAKKGGT